MTSYAELCRAKFFVLNPTQRWPEKLANPLFFQTATASPPPECWEGFMTKSKQNFLHHTDFILFILAILWANSISSNF